MLNIQINIFSDDELIAKRETSSWEIAEQNLESLKMWYEKEKAEAEDMEAEDIMEGNESLEEKQERFETEKFAFNPRPEEMY